MPQGHWPVNKLTGHCCSSPVRQSTAAAAPWASCRCAAKRNQTRRSRRALWWLRRPFLVTGACSGEPCCGGELRPQCELSIRTSKRRVKEIRRCARPTWRWRTIPCRRWWSETNASSNFLTNSGKEERVDSLDWELPLMLQSSRTITET
jgi:hypothetical protein